jgi:hypothetical protein
MVDKVLYPSAETLIEEARAETRLDDFGPGEFREGLGRLLESLQQDVPLGQASADQLIGSFRRRLTNRLEIEAWRRDHPEIAAVKVGPPVSITGLPRTGTTALANVLSLEDQFRPLRSWEQTKCCPPPVLEEEERDPRRLAALAGQERMAKERPEMMALHLYDADTTEEDVEILGMSFRSQQGALPVFSYQDWWRGTDLIDAFAYHRRVLQLLQSRRPPDRWLLKAPAHNFHLDSFFSAYPDGKVVMTHRDPTKAAVSAVSFIASLWPKELAGKESEYGPKIAEHFRLGAENAMAARARIGEHHFHDVQHTDFVSDPFGTIERIYAFLGLELTPKTLKKMEDWHARNRSGAYGAHRYTPEQFGLTKAGLREDFAPYVERYNIPLEG